MTKAIFERFMKIVLGKVLLSCNQITEPTKLTQGNNHQQRPNKLFVSKKLWQRKQLGLPDCPIWPMSRGTLARLIKAG